MTGTASETPPPGFGDCTVTSTVPALDVCSDVSVTASSVGLTQRVWTCDPPKNATEFGTNPCPLTRRVAVFPCVRTAGTMLRKRGAGLYRCLDSGPYKGNGNT